MKAIENDPRVIADISTGSTPPIDTCSCSDTPPDSQYTCEQQVFISIISLHVLNYVTVVYFYTQLNVSKLLCYLIIL